MNKPTTLWVCGFLPSLYVMLRVALLYCKVQLHWGFGFRFFCCCCWDWFFFSENKKKAPFPSSNQIDFIDLNSQSNTIKSLELNFQAIDRTSVKFY